VKSSRNKVAGIFAGIRYGRGLFQGKPESLTIEIFLYLRPNSEAIILTPNTKASGTTGFNELKEES